MTHLRLLGFRALPLGALMLLALGSRACGGNEFSSAGGGGTDAGVPGASCRSPEDCDDGDPCTIDDCGPAGACVSNWKCAVGLQCCSGTCGECCGDEECDDTVPCTSDACVAGFCSSAPGSCGQGEYCSIPRGGCVPLETCGEGQTCDDGDACTEDECDGAFCTHSFCQSGGKCCDGRPDLGCNSCCANTECDDGDLCTDDACTPGGCVHSPKSCGADTSCCPGTGQCAECCSQSECDDAIDCTADTCEGGSCRHTPMHEECAPGQVCVGGGDGGCQMPAECSEAEDCVGQNPCETFACESGRCISSPKVCPDGTICCSDAPEGTEACQRCCSDADCDGPACANPACVDGACTSTPDDTRCADATGIDATLTCDPELGCIACLRAEDCGSDVCFTYECKNNECASTRRFCDAAAPGVGSPETQFPCQDCCENSDCPSRNGSPAICCRGLCCVGGCDQNTGACAGSATDG